MTPILNLTSLDWMAPDSLAGWLLRVTLIAAFASAYLALATRARPVTRHAVAVASLVAILVLPVASAILPSLSVPVLPAPTVQIDPSPKHFAGGSFAIDASRPSPAPVTTPEPVRAVPNVIGNVSPLQTVSTSTPVRAEAARDVDWRRLALIAWLSVTVALLLRIAVASVRAGRLARPAPSGPGPEVVLESERACRVLGIRRAIDVSLSPVVTIPMVVGTLRPRVLLPAAAASWSRERLRVVLLHELAHVARRDGLWMTVARVATAVFWFHPLVWTLSSHVRREAERACDETVLASGVRNSDYAHHLIDVARGAMARGPAGALALATRSSLERRVVAVLSAQPRAAASSRSLAAAACGALAMFVLIAAARPTSSARMTPFEDLGGARTADYAGDPKDAGADAGYTLAVASADVAGDAGGPDEQTRYYLAEQRRERSGHDWYSKARDLYNSRRYARAGEAFENAARLGYRRGTALYNAGCSYALADQPGRALDALRESFEEGFDRPDLFAADEDLNSLRNDPRFKKLLHEAMNSGSAQASRRAAAREFERLEKRGDVREGHWNSVGMHLLRSGDYDRAADAFEREFKVSQDGDAIYNKACARALAGKKDEALTLLREAITIGTVDAEHMEEDPDLVALHGEKRFDEMLKLTRDLTLHDHETWSKSYDKWWKRDENAGWKRAIPRLEKATRDHPDIGRAWFNLGYAQLAADDPKPGAASFQRALDLGYRPPTTMYNLACCAAQSGDIDGAFAWLERAEKAGMKVWWHLHDDDDLDPIRKDRRYKEMSKRWRASAEMAKNDEDFDYDYDYKYEHDDEEEDEEDDIN